MTESASTAEPFPSILVESTSIIYRRRRWSAFANIPVILLAFWVGRGLPSQGLRFTFVGLLIAYTIVTATSAFWVTARPLTEASARVWAGLLYVELGILGLLYNLIFLHLVSLGEAEALDYLILLVALFCSGGAAAYQHLRGVIIVFIFSSVSPLVAYHLLSGIPAGNVTAFILVAFMLFMSMTGLGLHREARQRLLLNRELQSAKAEAERQARTDSLTRLLNRRAVFEIGKSLFAAARRTGRPLSVIMIDVDHFKSINDRFGHAGGDAVLRRIAEILREVTRDSDIVGRLGGEELAVLLPETDESEAVRTATRIAQSFRSADLGDVTPGLDLTASFGVAESTDDDAALDELIDRADRALYQAKATGRDRIVPASEL